MCRKLHSERDLALSLRSHTPFLKRTCSCWGAVCMYSRCKLLVLILCSSPAVLSLSLTETIIKSRGNALPQPATGACMGNAWPFLHQGLVTSLAQVVLFIEAFLLCLPPSGIWRNGAEREYAFEAMRGPHKHQSNTLWKFAKTGPMAIGLITYPRYKLTVHKAYESRLLSGAYTRDGKCHYVREQAKQWHEIND